MLHLLDNKENLQILEELVSGNAVSVNIASLSRKVDKHRNTVNKKVENLIKFKIIDPPSYPFIGLYNIFPLLAVIHMDIPCVECVEKFEKWIKEDPHVFAAFKSRQGEYDTLLFTYHKNITDYQLWMLVLPSILRVKFKIPAEYARPASSTSYFSSRLMIKYNPNTGIKLLEKSFEKNNQLTIQGYNLDQLDLNILKLLLTSKCIKTNNILLCEKTGLHRKTIEKRISAFIKAGIISLPLCRFPNFYSPHDHLLTYMTLEVKHLHEKLIREIIMDPHIAIALQSMYGKYNMLLFTNHRTMEDQIKWEEEYRKKFPFSFGSVNKNFLSPEMTINFNYHFVALSYIQSKLNKGPRDLKEIVSSLESKRTRILYGYSSQMLKESGVY